MIAKKANLLKTALLMLSVAGGWQCSPKPQGIAVEMPDQGQAVYTPSPTGSGNLTGARCQITATPSQVPPGGTVQLISQTFDEDFASMIVDNKPVQLPTGFTTVTPQATTEYRGIGIRKNGEQVTCSVTVIVAGGSTTTPPGGGTTTPPPSTMNCTLTATPATVNAGESSVLKIVAPNDATSIVVDGTALQNNGQKFVSPPSTQTYTALVSGPTGNGSCTATVTVNSSSNSGGGVGGLPNLRTTTKSCTVYAQQLSQSTCKVSCPSGWVLKDVSETPEYSTIKHGGRCDSSRSEYGDQAIICYGGTNTMFTGNYATCTCRILCEGY